MNKIGGIPDSKKKFTVEEDIILLQKVKKENPFSDIKKWVLITKCMENYSDREFTVKGVRRHINYLLKLSKEKGCWKNQKMNAKNSTQLKLREELIEDVAYLKNISEIKNIQQKYKTTPVKSSQSKKEKVPLKNEPKTPKKPVHKSKATSTKALQGTKKVEGIKNDTTKDKYEFEKHKLELEIKKLDLEIHQLNNKYNWKYR